MHRPVQCVTDSTEVGLEVVTSKAVVEAVPRTVGLQVVTSRAVVEAMPRTVQCVTDSADAGLQVVTSRAVVEEMPRTVQCRINSTVGRQVLSPKAVVESRLLQCGRDAAAVQCRMATVLPRPAVAVRLATAVPWPVASTAAVAVETLDANTRKLWMPKCHMAGTFLLAGKLVPVTRTLCSTLPQTIAHRGKKCDPENTTCFYVKTYEPQCLKNASESGGQVQHSTDRPWV